MRVSVIGCSALGTAQAVALAEMGHDVVGVDCNAEIVAALSVGRSAGDEVPLAEALADMLDAGRVRFTTDLAAIAGARVHIICVDAPPDRGTFAGDLTFADVAAEAVRPHLAPGDVVAGRSTVPLGTAERFAANLGGTGATLVLKSLEARSGFEFEDLLHPQRLVYGVPAGTPGVAATGVLDGVYTALLADGVPRLVTDYASFAHSNLAPDLDPVAKFLRAVEVTNARGRERLMDVVRDVREATHDASIDQLVATWVAYRDGERRPLAVG
ncbi:MAG: hypothetical protein ACOH2F_04970 [Cellulomonas sp.]